MDPPAFSQLRGAKPRPSEAAPGSFEELGPEDSWELCCSRVVLGQDPHLAMLLCSQHSQLCWAEFLSWSMTAQLQPLLLAQTSSARSVLPKEAG